MEQKKTFDHYPQYDQAGFENKDKNNSTKNCMTTEQPVIFLYIQQSVTPQNIRKYRQSYKQQHGVKIEHFGQFDDKKLPESHVYGHTVKGNGIAQDLLNPKKEKIHDMKNEIFERKYASQQRQTFKSKREPLAKSLSRNYILPKQIKDNNFEYGLKTTRNATTTSEVLFPHTLQFKENQEVQDKYIKSHQTYQPGQQKQRNYSWNLNLDTHSFGKATGMDNQIQNLVFKDNFNDKFPKTQIISKNQDDFEKFKRDHFEKATNLFQVNRYQDQDSTYGRKLQRDEWDAYKCMKGNGKIDSHSSYRDLGRNIKPGFRNTTKQGDEERIFGVPTYRQDLFRKSVSMADPTNYGTDPSVVELIFPQKFSFMGLQQSDFESLKDKQEIKDIFKQVGVDYKIGKFEAMYIRAQQIQKDNKVSVKAFLKAVNEMHNQN